MNILLWVIVAVSIALVCFAVAKQTGFKIPPLPLPTNKWVRRGITVSVVLVIIALFFPNVVGTITTNTIGWAKDFDENYGKAETEQQSAPADNNTGSYVASQTLQVVPGEGFKKVSVPPGRIIKDLTWDCPDGCILEIVHDGQPLCPTTNIYQGLPCGSLQPENGNSGDTVQREQFAMPYGNFINFPRNIILIGVSFGTDNNLGPIEVTVTVTI